MNGTGDSNIKLNIDNAGNVAYIRLDRHSTISTCSSIVLNSCSSDEEYDDSRPKPTLRWKRQKFLNTVNNDSEHPSNRTDTNSNLQCDQNSVISAKENVAILVDDERRAKPPRRLQPIPEDKLHRRNPHTVRQEINLFNDFIPDTTLADVHLNEMPGLHNTEHWKRIAGRTAHASPPLSRQYYSTVISTIGLQDGQVPQSLGSYRRPGRSENESEIPCIAPSSWRSPRRPVVYGSSAAVVLIAAAIAVVLAITLIKKSELTTSDYYAGSVYVRADFNASLLDPTSAYARECKKEFCQL
ncbi:unnamed protein product, partial [Rotaria magnacalcarata]